MRDDSGVTRDDILKMFSMIEEAGRFMAGLPQDSYEDCTHVAVVDGVILHRVSMKHVRSFEGDKLGANKVDLQCATGVQEVFNQAGHPIGMTRFWGPGLRVKGNPIPPGTAIASFRDGNYCDDHAAIFVKETKKGLVVFDQYEAKTWGSRTLWFGWKRKPYSNDGDLFYTISVSKPDRLKTRKDT